MRITIITAALFLSPLFFATPSQAENPELVTVSSQPPISATPLLPPVAPLASTTAQAPRPLPPKPENPTTSQQQPANIYPSRLVQSFMEGCTKKESNIGGVNMQSVCSCSINKIQNEYPLEEFMVMVLDMAEKKNKPPERIVQIATECAIENLSGR